MRHSVTFLYVEESLGGMLKVESTPNGAKFTIIL